MHHQQQPPCVVGQVWARVLARLSALDPVLRRLEQKRTWHVSGASNKDRHSLASCTSPPNVSVYSHTSWVLIIFFVLPMGSDARFSYQNYNSMIIESPKQLNIFMFSFRNTSFIMFKSWLRNIDHSGKRVMHMNHDCLDGLPKCMQITTMFLPCDSVTPNTYIHKRKCTNEK
jgi:hypothetical protein